jgi:hypothetical protein
LTFRGCPDAGFGVVGLFFAAGRECVDEAALRRGERPSCESCDRELADEWRASGEAEAFEVSAFDFFGDGVA